MTRQTNYRLRVSRLLPVILGIAWAASRSAAADPATGPRSLTGRAEIVALIQIWDQKPSGTGFVNMANVVDEFKGARDGEIIVFLSSVAEESTREAHYLVFLERTSSSLADLGETGLGHVGSRRLDGTLPPPTRPPPEAPVYQSLTRKLTIFNSLYWGSFWDSYHKGGVFLVSAESARALALSPDATSPLDGEGEALVRVSPKAVIDSVVQLLNQDISAVARPCRAADMSARFDGKGGGSISHSWGVGFVLKNISARPCYLKGFARISVRQRNRSIPQRPHPRVDGGGHSTPRNGERALLVPAGESADLYFEVRNGCDKTGDKNRLSDARSTSIVIGLPGERRSVGAVARAGDVPSPGCEGQPNVPLDIAILPFEHLHRDE